MLIYYYESRNNDIDVGMYIMQKKNSLCSKHRCMIHHVSLYNLREVLFLKLQIFLTQISHHLYSDTWCTTSCSRHTEISSSCTGQWGPTQLPSGLYMYRDIVHSNSGIRFFPNFFFYRKPQGGIPLISVIWYIVVVTNNLI